MSLRRLENAALEFMYKEQMVLDTGDVIRVSIGQFNGIEINDFAVTVARTALWIAESQMMRETEKIVKQQLDFLPLKTDATIVEGNALRLDWSEVVPLEKLNYIMGNPPFVGFTYMNASQKDDMKSIFGDVKNLDYVCGWYKKASDYINGTNIECGFVSTNSITQGETVGRFWSFLDIKVNFAHTTFIWNSEANQKAHVHCVIIGFANFDKKQKTIFQGNAVIQANNINAYLCDAPNIIVQSRNKPLCDIPSMIYGNKPADGGNLIIEAEEYDDFLKKEPQAEKFIKPFVGAVEFIHNKKRYCLWLVGANPSDLKKCPLIMERIAKCKEMRENSVAAAIRKFAETPTLFAQRTQPVGKPYIIVPETSSEKRKYIPMAFMPPDVITSNAVKIVPNANIYHFGILNSSVHNAWNRVVCGRLKSDYRYLKDIVYNNFPWCDPTPEQKAKVEQTAQAILDARAQYPDSSLADLYDETLMPIELRKAHKANDEAVLAAYGLSKNATESEIVAFLFKRYAELTESTKDARTAKKSDVDKNKLYAIKRDNEEKAHELVMDVDPDYEGFKGICYLTPANHPHMIEGKLGKKTATGFTFIPIPPKQGSSEWEFIEITYENFKAEYYKIVEAGEELLAQVSSTEELEEYYHKNFPS